MPEIRIQWPPVCFIATHADDAVLKGEEVHPWIVTPTHFQRGSYKKTLDPFFHKINIFNRGRLPLLGLWFVGLLTRNTKPKLAKSWAINYVHKDSCSHCGFVPWSSLLSISLIRKEAQCADPCQSYAKRIPWSELPMAEDYLNNM